jgi:hypothetical protein
VVHSACGCGRQRCFHGVAVQVKAGMLAGMLVGGDAGAQEELAQLNGVASALTALMRDPADADARTIGGQLFALLVRNPAAKPHLEAALRGAGAGG